MSARLIERASIVIPVQGTGLDSKGIVANPGLSSLIRRALTDIADAASHRPVAK
jgi:hypothetical protein